MPGGVAYRAEAAGDFLLDLGHAQIAFGAIVGELDVGMPCEAQDCVFVAFEGGMEVFGIGPGHTATRPRLPLVRGGGSGSSRFPLVMMVR